MRSEPLSSGRRGYRKGIFWLFLLTVMVFFGHYWLPPKKLELRPTEHLKPELYGVANAAHGRSGYWIDEPNGDWRCDYQPTHPYGCGWVFPLTADLTRGMDFREYEVLELTIRYQGPAARLRVFLRNYNSAYANLEDMNSFQISTVGFPVGETSQSVQINLQEFSVAGWWLSDRKGNMRWTQPEFQSITHIGLDIIEQGVHDVRIESVTLKGRRIKTETLLIVIISLWMAFFLLEGIVRFFQVYREAQLNRITIKQLEEQQRALAEENKQLETIANTDPLTGVLNRGGLHSAIEKLQNDLGTLAGLRIMLLDIDHFKSLNDRYGHDMGDKVLKTFAALLAMNLRENDIFARLGGEEFVVVCQQNSADSLHSLAEKLRQLALRCTFNGDNQLHISVSIGVTIIAEDEEFSAALKRADIALYKAKQGGRNRVEYEPQL